jgi:hypothetical protein
MKRFDLKTEKAVRDLDREKNMLKSLIDTVRDDVDKKVRTVTNLVYSQSYTLEDVKKEVNKVNLNF